MVRLIFPVVGSQAFAIFPFGSWPMQPCRLSDPVMVPSFNPSFLHLLNSLSFASWHFLSDLATAC